MRVLHVAAEIFPLVKTGGLADVVGALPRALINVGADVRLLLPGLPPILDAVLHQRTVCEVGPAFGALRISVRRGQLPFSQVPVYVIDSPYLYRRGGGPYENAQGVEWGDNLQRFALLGWVAAHLAAGEIDTAWTPQIVHAHDWHAAMTCAYMAAHPGTSAPSVYTVHNLAYQGLFAPGDFPALGLPSAIWASHGIEYHDRISFMKAGLKYAQRITTVSPTYAREIATHEFGCGLDGVVRSRAGDVYGILNGVDGDVWNPATDMALASRYSATDVVSGKSICRAALRAEFGLEPSDSAPLFGVVSRLSGQKGLDLVLAALPALLRQGGQLCLQGSGDAALEAAFSAVARANPDQVAVRIGYDEITAHRLIAGADALLVPSRFEPCGLTQLYALRYGSVPVVRRVGGLADTVVDATPQTLNEDRASGFAFDAATPAALEGAVQRAVQAFQSPAVWQQLVRRGMAQDFSWNESASSYLALYREMLGPAAAAPSVGQAQRI